MKTITAQEKQNLVSLKQATSSLLNRYANFLSQELEEPVSPGRDCSFSHRNLQISKKTHTFAVLTDNGCTHFAGQAVNLLNTFGLFLCPKSTYIGGRIYVDKIKALGVETIICKQRIWRPLFCCLNKKICLQMKTLTTKAISDGSHRVQPSLSLIKRYANFLSQELEEPVSPGRDCSFSHRNLQISKKTHTFVVQSNLRQASQLADTAGIFYARKNMYKVSTPVWSVNAPTACLRWIATGKRNLFSFSPSVNYLFNVSF